MTFGPAEIDKPQKLLPIEVRTAQNTLSSKLAIGNVGKDVTIQKPGMTLFGDLYTSTITIQLKTGRLEIVVKTTTNPKNDKEILDFAKDLIKRNGGDRTAYIAEVTYMLPATSKFKERPITLFTHESAMRGATMNAPGYNETANLTAVISETKEKSVPYEVNGRTPIQIIADTVSKGSLDIKKGRREI